MERRDNRALENEKVKAMKDMKLVGGNVEKVERRQQEIGKGLQ